VKAGSADNVDHVHVALLPFSQNAPRSVGTRILAVMAYDEWEHEYHLTPNGWVTGSFYFRGTLAKKVSVPIDRVLTMVQENFNSSSSAGLQTSWEQNWQSSGCSQEKIGLLLVKFGDRPPEEITFRLDERTGIRIG
jgi:hypothetical protein